MASSFVPPALSARAASSTQKMPPSSGALTPVQQRAANLRALVSTAPPSRPATASPTTPTTPSAGPQIGVARVTTTRMHATGALRSRERVLEADGSFLAAPTRSSPLPSALLTTTTATFSIVDEVPRGASRARMEMEGRLAQAQQAQAQVQAAKATQALAQAQALKDAEQVTDQVDALNTPVAGADAGPTPVASLDLLAATASTAAPNIVASDSSTSLVSTVTSLGPDHVTPAGDALTLETMVLRTADGLDLLDFEFVLQKLLSLVAGSPVHDLFQTLLSDFFKRVFKHFLTVDSVKREVATISTQKQLLHDAARDIERELRLMKQKNSSMELTIATQDGMIQRRTTELTAAREKYYAHLLLIREIVQQHGIHPDLLVSYMPGDIASSDAKAATAEKARADLLENYNKIHALMDHRITVLLTAMKATIFGLMQQHQRKLDKCNAKIRTLDVYLSKARYKMKYQRQIFDMLIRGELTPEKIFEIQEKHARDEEIAAAEKSARKAAALEDEEPPNPQDGEWRDLADTHPQGYAMLVNLAARHRAQWERMERQARDEDCELMDDEDARDHIDLVLRDQGIGAPSGSNPLSPASKSVANTARSTASGLEWTAADEAGDEDDAAAAATVSSPRNPPASGGKRSKQLPPSSSSKSAVGGSSRRASRKSISSHRKGDSASSSAASSRRGTALSPAASIAALLSEDRGDGPTGKKGTPGSKKLSKKTPERKQLGQSASQASSVSIASVAGTARGSESRRSFDDGGSGTGTDEEPLSARQRHIQQEWADVETESIERASQRSARNRAPSEPPTPSRDGAPSPRSFDDDSSAPPSPVPSPPHSANHRDSPSRPASSMSHHSRMGGHNEKGESGSLLRPGKESRRGSGSWTPASAIAHGSDERGFTFRLPEPSTHSGSATPRSGRSGARSSRDAAKQYVRAELSAIRSELAAGTNAHSMLERKNREILDKIRALDTERKLLNTGPATSPTSSGVSGLTSMNSTRRNSGTFSINLEDAPPGTAGSTKRSGSASDAASEISASSSQPPELPSDRAHEEALLRAKDDRSGRIAQATQIERARKDLERERRLTERENAKLATRLRVLELKKREMKDAMEGLNQAEQAEADSERLGLGGPDFREHSNIFQKVVMRSVGLQVGVSFTYTQQGGGMDLASQDDDTQPRSPGRNPETKEAETDGSGLSLAGSNFHPPAGSYPHPLMLQMQALGVDPLTIQTYLDNQFRQAAAYRAASPSVSLDGPSVEPYATRNYADGSDIDHMSGRVVRPTTSGGGLSSRRSGRDPTTLEAISTSLSLSGSQRDVLFARELRRRKDLEKSMSVFARLQARGATNQEATRHLRGQLQQERTHEMERVLKDLDLLKQHMDAEPPAPELQAVQHDDPRVPSPLVSSRPTTASAFLHPGTAVARSRGPSSLAGSNASSRPSTARLTMSIGRDSTDELGAWSGHLDAARPGESRPVSRKAPRTSPPPTAPPSSASYPHVIPSAVSRPSSAMQPSNHASSGSASERRVQLLTAVMGDERRALQSQQGRKGQSYSP